MEDKEKVWEIVFVRNDGSAHRSVVNSPASFEYYHNQVFAGNGEKVALLLNGEIAKMYSREKGFETFIEV